MAWKTNVSVKLCYRMKFGGWGQANTIQFSFVFVFLPDAVTIFFSPACRGDVGCQCIMGHLPPGSARLQIQSNVHLSYLPEAIVESGQRYPEQQWSVTFKIKACEMVEIEVTIKIKEEWWEIHSVKKRTTKKKNPDNWRLSTHLIQYSKECYKDKNAEKR